MDALPVWILSLAQWAVPMVLLVLAVTIGGRLERRHLRTLTRQEAARSVVLDTRKRVTRPEEVEAAKLVTGQVVIATDYWKTFTTTLRNLVGGEMRAADRMMERGRREALQRLAAAAEAMDAQEVWNLRLQFSSVSQMRGKRGAMQVEVLAFGTAVRRRRG